MEFHTFVRKKRRLCRECEAHLWLACGFGDRDGEDRNECMMMMMTTTMAWRLERAWTESACVAAPQKMHAHPSIGQWHYAPHCAAVVFLHVPRKCPLSTGFAPHMLAGGHWGLLQPFLNFQDNFGA
ncbi:hypothetical protein ACLOJK_016073 [Asimina triloba]